MLQLRVRDLLGVSNKLIRSNLLRRQLSATDASAVANASKSLFQFVPQSVCVVTPEAIANEKGQKELRGMTCSSFTNVSNSPPILSFSVRSESSMVKSLEKSNHFGVHVLGKNQLHLAVRFALRPRGQDPYEGINYSLSERNVPIIPDCVGFFECSKHSAQQVGDHHVFFGAVTQCTLNPALRLSTNGLQPDASKLKDCEPLVFFMRQYLTVGDAVFMRAFEERQLPFEQWTHDAHLRMAFNYLTRFGKERAIPRIRNGIRHFNEANKAHIRVGYHETITMCFVHLLDAKISEWRKQLFAKTDKVSEHELMRDALSFEKFLEYPPARELLNTKVILNHYSEERISSVFARHSFVLPDRQPLPGVGN